MVFGWRRAFCTSVPREPDSDSTLKPTKHKHNHDHDNDHDSGKCNTPKFGSRFVFFSSSSNPSTPRLQSHTDSSPNLRCRTRTQTQTRTRTTNTATIQEKSASVPVSPKLRCKTSNSPKLFQWSSTPSSPRSPSTFSLLKANLRLSTNRCGLCLQSVKSGRGVAIYTAECSHSFHFPCIAGYVKEKGSLACPVCGTMRKETPVFSINKTIQNHKELDKLKESKLSKQNSFRPDLKVYNDDEPIGSLTPKGGFNPIPESDENCDEDLIEEFQGFHINNNCSYNSPVNIHARDVDVWLLPEAAMISSTRGYETYAIVMRAKAPSMCSKTERRAPIDLVTVIDVSGNMTNEKLQMMKRTMRTIIASLSSSDRLSIVAFSSYSKRLLHLKRMTTSGQRAARRIVEAMAVLEGSSNATDAVKKAAKVLEDRREKNTVSSIFLLSDVPGQSSHVSTTRYQNVAVHTLKLAASDDYAFAKTIRSLLTVTVQNLQLQLGLVSGSLTDIVSVYSHAPRAVALVSGTGTDTGTGTGTVSISIGELCENEEREMLIELKVPASAVGVHTVLSVRCSYRESETQEVIYCNEHELVVPRPHTVRSSSLTIQRLRNLFITTRALAESRVLTARNDLIGAYHMLISARAVLNQTSSGCNEFVVSVEAELNELQRRRVAQAERGRVEPAEGEPLTPISAWRVAEKLAKVAMMRKTLNRVSDLHGFEDARF